jgi:hypothetical protein
MGIKGVSIAIVLLIARKGDFSLAMICGRPRFQER